MIDIRPKTLLGKSLYILSILLFLLGQASTVAALSAEQQKVFNDGIYYFNVLACGASSSSGAGGNVNSLTGSDNVHKAFNFFIAEGLSPAQAAGIIANLYNESGVDPTSGGSPTDGVGFGIAQWTYTARQAPLIAFAASQNKPVTDLLVQLQFMWQELSTGYKSTLDGLKQISGNDTSAAGQAAVYFRDHYEVCDKTVTSCSDRQSVGEQMFQKIGSSGGGSSGGSTTIDASCSGSSTTTGGLTNPFPGGWTTSRLDMGMDGTFRGQIVAPFSGTITYASESFSNWGGYLEIKADPGQKPSALPTSTLYFAEGLSPIVRSGHVNAGQPIANAVPNRIYNGIVGNIEWGVAQDGPGLTDTYAKVAPNPKQMVLDFSSWAQQAFRLSPPTDTSKAGYP